MKKFNMNTMKGTAVFCIIALAVSVTTIISSQNVNAQPPCRIMGPNEQWIDDPSCVYVIKGIWKCEPCPWKDMAVNLTEKVIPEDLLKHDAYVLLLQKDNVSLIPTQAESLIKVLKEAKLMP
jgi:hypothetical protein